MKEKLKPIDPSLFDDLESEVDWNFDEEFLKPNEVFKKDSPELVKILEKYVDQSPAKKD